MSIEIESPKKIWKPNPGPQEFFLSLPDSVFEAFYGGAAGGGKSDALLMLPIVREFYKNPAFKGIVFRRTFPELEESLIARSKQGIGFREGKIGPSYYDFGAKYNDQKHVWTFPSGATIRFSYLDNDDDVYKHQSSEFHYLAFDELTHFTEFMYLYLVSSRVRSADPTLPAIVRSASNPGNIGHLWVREKFVEPFRQGRRIILYKRPNGTTGKKMFVPAKLKDNPCLNEADPEYANRLEGLPESERKALKEGDWWTFSGQYFTEFRDRLRPGEPPNAVHIIEPILIPSYWPKVNTLDWGWDHLSAFYQLAISPDKRVFVTQEMTCRKTPNAEIGSRISRLCQGVENIVTSVIDPATKAQKGDEETIFDQISQSSGLLFESADNDRIGGWQLFHDFLRWRPRSARYTPKEGYQDEVAFSIYRNQGEKAYKEYLGLFKPEEPETSIPRLQIFSTCSQLIKTIPIAVHCKSRVGSTVRVEDIEKFDGDDPLDSLRYGLKAIHRYLELSANAFSNVQKEDAIRLEYEASQNYFRFNQKMRKLNVTPLTPNPVLLHHKAKGKKLSIGTSFN